MEVTVDARHISHSDQGMLCYNYTITQSKSVFKRTKEAQISEFLAPVT